MFSLRNKKKISLNYPQYPHLSGALISGVTGLLHNWIMTPNIQEYLSLNTCEEANKEHVADGNISEKDTPY